MPARSTSPTFGQLVGAVWDSRLDLRECAVMTALLKRCECQRGEYACDEPLDSLAAAARYSRSAVKLALKALCDARLVARDDTYGKRSVWRIDALAVMAIRGRVAPCPTQSATDPVGNVTPGQPLTRSATGPVSHEPPPSQPLTPTQSLADPPISLDARAAGPSSDPSSDPITTTPPLPPSGSEGESSSAQAPTGVGKVEQIVIPGIEPEPAPAPVRKVDVVKTQAREVYAYWCDVMGKSGPAASMTTASGKKRIARAEARLREGYTVEQLRAAVDGCRASDYHRGQNDTGAVYDDLELICRDGKHVEQFVIRKRSQHKANGDTIPPAAAPANGLTVAEQRVYDRHKKDHPWATHEDCIAAVQRNRDRCAALRGAEGDIIAF